MISEYAEEKIAFLEKSINRIQDPELRGTIVDLIAEIKSGEVTKPKVEKAYCMGFVAGVSESGGKNLMDALTVVRQSYNDFVNEGYL